MRKILLAFVLFSTWVVNAQITEVNPNIKWEYVRSQEIQLQSSRTYQFEFPAEKGYDYIFNLNHSEQTALASMSVLDLQYKPLSSLTDSSNRESMDLPFRVQDNGTYIVLVVLSADQQDALLPSTITLIRRPIVSY